MKFILFFLVSSAYSLKTSKDVLRIMGGRNATENEFPYVVKLVLQKLGSVQANIFVCTSIVLTTTWTLTAGHCIASVDQLTDSTSMIQTKLMLEYQSTPKSESAYSEILSTALHPGKGKLANDIGLLHTQPVIFATYGKISSLDYTTLNGQQVFLVGYGMINENQEEASPSLPLFPQVLELIVKDCPYMTLYPEVCFAPPCFLDKHKSKALCPGDSGGPSIHPSGVVAINTITDARDCGMYKVKKLRRDRYDAGYNIGTATPLSPFIDWISSVIQSEAV
ncbi:serine protease 3-like [Epargyreus clarus]|uniref:serine protease 3-like n=1 Tax=Epargyreus clarus TaxID=520877 RepID=UPI003C2F3BC3